MADRFSFGVFFIFCSCFLGALITAKETIPVSVYYESLCPDSKRFIIDQLQPSYKKIANNIVLELIPYGNAKTSGKHDAYKFICQHGEEECRGNIIQICAIRIMNSTEEKLHFVSCAFEQASQYKISQQCIKSPSIQKKVQDCADGPMGKNLLYEMGVKTDTLKPRHTFIPWITFDNTGGSEINAKANENFVGTLCEFYKTDLPNFCQPSRKRRTDFYHRLVGL